MGLPNVPTHIPCASCNSEIDADADACPDCGKPNEWVNPILLKLIDYAIAKYTVKIGHEAKGNKLSLFHKHSGIMNNNYAKIFCLILFSCLIYLFTYDILNHFSMEITYTSRGLPTNSIVDIVMVIFLLIISIFLFLDIFEIYKLKSPYIKVDLRKNPAIISVSRERVWRDIINYIKVIESNGDISDISVQTKKMKKRLYIFVGISFALSSIFLIVILTVFM